MENTYYKCTKCGRPLDYPNCPDCEYNIGPGDIKVDIKVNDKEDNVNNPKHYNSHPSGVKCIEIVEWMSFNLGTAMTYIWRCNDKYDDPIEDLQKAIWYLNREITKVRGIK